MFFELFILVIHIYTLIFVGFDLMTIWQALDHVIAEARRYGIRLILCLVNNLQAYGGKTQYVKWAWDEGVGVSSSNDSFFYDPSIRQYYKNYVKVTSSLYHLISWLHSIRIKCRLRFALSSCDTSHIV